MGIWPGIGWMKPAGDRIASEVNGPSSAACVVQLYLDLGWTVCSDVVGLGLGVWNAETFFDVVTVGFPVQFNFGFNTFAALFIFAFVFTVSSSL